jgi:iron(II)-dependent oxidoreductase
VSGFDAYDGFEAFPYPEYSEPFFGGPFKMLKGGSWATQPDGATCSFRNWDYPERRQIFAGFRCARDAEAGEKAGR